MFNDDLGGESEMSTQDFGPLNLTSVAVPFTFIANAQMIINALVNGYGDTPGLSTEDLRDFIIAMHELANDEVLTDYLEDYFLGPLD